VAVLGAVVVALAGVAAALASDTTGSAVGAQLGANDDTGKYAADGGAVFYERMAADGLKQTVITVRWTPSDPLGLPERAMLERAVATATAAGIRVVFATYPYPPRELEGGLATPDAFATWLEALARSFPQVTQFVVGNEPNQPAFFRPQFVRGKQASAARFGPYLAAAYDALKAIDPAIRVVGVGLSPRGNDRPNARSNVSTSPVRFIAALGTWYRKSGRLAPLMDGFSYHPYPNRATDPLTRGYTWPNAGFVDLDRIKQALWDAFRGTPQPTTVNGLRLYLDEVGWQVDTSGIPGYRNAENVAVTDDDTQAEIYAELVRRATCEPEIAEVNIFGFFDDTNRIGFQAGLNRWDGTPRPSAQAVRDALAEGCAAPRPAWVPERGVVGATAPAITRSAGALTVAVSAAEGAIGRVCVLAGRRSEVELRQVLARAATPECAGAAVSPIRPTRIVVADPGGTVTVGVRLSAAVAPKRRTTSVGVID
jgi:hypothetical protein